MAKAPGDADADTSTPKPVPGASVAEILTHVSQIAGIRPADILAHRLDYEKEVAALVTRDGRKVRVDREMAISRGAA